MERKAYTIQVSRFDKRTKTGKRHVEYIDYVDVTASEVEGAIRAYQFDSYPEDKFEMTYFPTYTERTNLMSGEKYMEHFLTPYHCSPASESYWSN